MDYTIILKGEDGDYTAICYEMPSLSVVDTDPADAVLELVDLIETEIAFGEALPEPLEFSEALAAVGL